MWQAKPHLQFLTAHVNEQRYQEFYEAYQQLTPDLPLHFFSRRSQDVMAAADVVVVTSGTATLETMLYKTPMVIAYKMSSLTYLMAKLLVKTRFAGLPNLLANDLMVPELIQSAATPDAIYHHVLDYLEHPEKVAALQKRFTDIHKSLRADSASCIAESIMTVVKK